MTDPMTGADSYFRPLVQCGPARPADALPLAGGAGWFCHVEVLSRSAPARIIAAPDLPEHAARRLCDPRGDIVGLSMDRPRVMGILNATPDSFSDGGLHETPEAAVAGGMAMVQAGVDMLDIGGESTRPGADDVDPEEESRRVTPVISGLRAAGASCVISVDTRKTPVARQAVAAGGDLINDVSGFTHDTALAGYCAEAGLPVCVMHAQGDPATMQQAPRYDDVVLDVYDFLAAQIAMLESAGIDRSRIIADPGIGFGKTQAHNLALLARLSLFHGLGVPLLLGVSRKKFIGTIGGAAHAQDRMPGSVAVALAGVAQGVQILRVHDVPETLQALALWQAATQGAVAS
jgi:dihydropteroate synthase